MNRIMKSAAMGVVCVAAMVLLTSSASAALFRLDLEAAGTAGPGGPGGKSITIANSDTATAVTMDVYGLYQNADTTALSDSIKLVAAFFRSSNGGLLGNLSAAATGAWADGSTATGTPNDVDLDGDLDIGGTFGTATQFTGAVNLNNDYGFGTGNGAATGVVAGSLLGLTGNWAYGKVGTLTFTITAAQAAGDAGKQTTVTMIPNTTTTGSGVAANFQAHENSPAVATSNSTASNQAAGLAGVVISVAGVPEPGTCVLAGFGAIGLAVCGLRRRRVT